MNMKTYISNILAVSNGVSVSGINVFSFLDDMSSTFTFGLFERTEDMIKPRASGVLYSQVNLNHLFLSVMRFTLFVLFFSVETY